MKQYKYLEDVWSGTIEADLNELASQGWVVKSFNVVFEGEDNSNQKVYALLEYDDFDLEQAMHGIFERLNNISDKTGVNRSSDTDLHKVETRLSQILEQLEGVYENTSRIS